MSNGPMLSVSISPELLNRIDRELALVQLRHGKRLSRAEFTRLAVEDALNRSDAITDDLSSTEPAPAPVEGQA